jgi:catechol 2,3-dioxygenase-like lactoylglutathione lyase family enzyme
MKDQPLLSLYSPVVRVQNLERSQQWYESVLGLAVSFRDPHYRLRVLTDELDHRLTIWERDSDSPPHLAHRNGAYLVFVTPDIETVRRELIRRGGQPEEIGNYPGLRIFWLADPDTHRHAVIQFMLE